jgi:photosystem II stability/assembly factor-like uncharacterized protein
MMKHLPIKHLAISTIFCLALAGFLSTAKATAAAEQSVIAPLATKSLLLDLERIDNALVAVGERGHVLISEDSGKNWTQIRVPTRATLTGVFFHDRQHGWIVGHDQVILKTVDGGQSWRQVYIDIEADSPLFDIYFLDAEHGYAIGAYGQFLESFDGGDSWEGRWISEDDFHLNQIVRSGNRLFIAAEAGFVYRSDDMGENWTVLSPAYEGSFFGILPLDNRHLLLFGLRGNLFRSDDGGEHWSHVTTASEASLTNGLQLNDGRIVLSGLEGAILVSRNRGQSFELIQDPQRKGFSRMRQTPTGDIVAVGDFGVTGITLKK